ncbi:hypothetical protein D1871_08920 [Nakamurella silvestris]|nr:hypothetical protein D1871_08920 [Nakamurella silvestris]
MQHFQADDYIVIPVRGFHPLYAIANNGSRIEALLATETGLEVADVHNYVELMTSLGHWPALSVTFLITGEDWDPEAAKTSPVHIPLKFANAWRRLALRTLKAFAAEITIVTPYTAEEVREAIEFITPCDGASLEAERDRLENAQGPLKAPKPELRGENVPGVGLVIYSGSDPYGAVAELDDGAWDAWLWNQDSLGHFATRRQASDAVLAIARSDPKRTRIDGTTT